MSSNQTGQEERDLLFARLFGLNAIIQSGLLLRTRTTLPRSASSPSTPKSCAAVLDALLALARAKSWLAEAAYWTVGRAMSCLATAAEEDVPWREEAARNLFEGVFGEDSSSEGGARKSGSIWTPEKIALALRAQRLWPGREHEWRRLWAPTLKHGNVLHLANLATLAKVLKVCGPFPYIVHTLTSWRAYRKVKLRTKGWRRFPVGHGDRRSITSGTSY
jgi:DNA polymerase phi